MHLFQIITYVIILKQLFASPSANNSSVNNYSYNKKYISVKRCCNLNTKTPRLNNVQSIINLNHISFLTMFCLTI